MERTMMALVKYGQEPKNCELREVPVPEIGPDDVLLETKAAGICGSDIEMWLHKFTYTVNVPVIQGHEFCGVIKEIGSNVTGFAVGDRIVSETSAYVCGACRFCLTGDYNLCPDRLGFGYGTNGAFTKYVKVRKQILHRIPEGISFEEAAITEPVCVGYNVVAVQSKIKPGDTVVVIGPGPIGLNCLQIAKLSGASRVLVIGTEADVKRLEIAAKLGADVTVNVSKNNPVETVKKYSDGYGADLVVDAAGNTPAFKLSMELVRRLGQITKVGWGPDPVDVSLDTIITKSATLQGAYGHNWETWRQVLNLISCRKVALKPLLTHVLPLEKWEEGFELVHTRQAVKVILKP